MVVAKLMARLVELIEKVPELHHRIAPVGARPTVRASSDAGSGATATNASTMALTKIKQIRSANRRHRKQRATLIALGLNKIGRVRWVVDTAQMRGLINKVSNLAQIENHRTARKPIPEPPVYDEAAPMLP
jgi:large subunit ribosomal protein L30